jgi:serine/threonine protein kinase
MHNAGFIHRDIKPNNFVMGLPGSPHQNQLYLLDFGLSKPFMKNGIHFPQLPPGRSLTGTARYASINSHQG